MIVKQMSWWPRVRMALYQVLIVILINVPTVSFGLAMGWVSLASGETGASAAGEEEASRGAVVAAVTTFTASLVGVPLSARALSSGRKVALIGTSFCFVICWSLKLLRPWGGEACIVAARIPAGLGGAAAWALSPLLAREMCSERYRGAAVSALAVAHNVGILLMYLAADLGITNSTVLWWCAGLAVVHCVAFAFVPESPSYLAAQNKLKEARESLAWFRGMSLQDPDLEAELAALPPPEVDQSSWSLLKELLSDRQRRRAFIIGTVAVIGQEVCGILAILQYAERVFVLARGDTPVVVLENITSATMSPVQSLDTALVTPARHALVLGAVQLVMSVLSLYLVERVGRRPLLVSCATVTGAALAVAAWGAVAAGGSLVAAAVSVAVAADAAGLQPAPYAVLADMFHYKYRSCALMVATAGACAGNAVEVAVFPGVAAAGGLRAALAVAAALTLAYAVFALLAVPETRARSPQQIYDAICPPPDDHCETGASDKGDTRL